MTPSLSSMSLHSGESPAMFPSAHTHCSCTSGYLLSRPAMKAVVAPAAMTAYVSWADPEATLVSTQADSNWSLGLLPSRKNDAKMSSTPSCVTARIGGLRSAGAGKHNALTGKWGSA